MLSPCSCIGPRLRFGRRGTGLFGAIIGAGVLILGLMSITPVALQAQDASVQGGEAQGGANPYRRMFFVNPYSGSMTEDEIAASAKISPPISDAKWEHEACMTAYAWQVAEPDYRKQLDAARDVEKDKIAEALRVGAFDAAQAREAYAELDRAVANKLASWREKAAGFTKNIRKCRGTFFRPAAIDVCNAAEADQLGTTPNPFCMAARGTGSLEGVSFTDDKLAMGHSVAWNTLGVSSTDPHGFRETDWFVIGMKEYVEPKYNKMAISLAVGVNNFEEAHDLTTKAKNDAIEAALDSEYRITMRGAEPAAIATGKAVSFLGSWHVSLEMIRVRKADMMPAVLEQIRSISAASGIPWDLGEYAQFPRLHFQTNIPDVLIQAEHVKFGLGRIGEGRLLDADAPFELVADRAPAMKSSFASKRVHAASIPTAADWTILRDPASTLLFVSTYMTIEDGSIDQIDIPLNWSGFRQALANLTKVQQTVAERTIAVTDTWNSRLADIRGRLNWYQASLQKAETEARALVAMRKPLNFNCASFPSTYGDASSINELADERIACQDRWFAEVYKPHWDTLFSYRPALTRGGFKQTLAMIDQEIARWQSRQTANREELQSFNLAVEARNQQIREAPLQQAQRRNAPSTRQTRYTDAWRRGEQRRRGSAQERDYASEFFESQRDPTPLTQYPPVPVRRPPSYFRPGYF
jgi:hypothetical protein